MNTDLATEALAKAVRGRPGLNLADLKEGGGTDLHDKAEALARSKQVEHRVAACYAFAALTASKNPGEAPDGKSGITFAGTAGTA